MTGMATKPYMKLDLDWHDDPKVLDFQDRYGKAAVVDLIKLFCVEAEFFGSVDLKDNGQKIKLQQVLGKKGKSLTTFLDKVASCGLIDPDAYSALGRVGSARSMKDGKARANRRGYALAASEAAKKKRQEDEGEP